jgi:kinesin family member 2/24
LFTVSFYEIYGGKCYDLLNNRSPLTILEDKNQEVQIPGLEVKIAESPDEMLNIIEFANSVRTTHQTVANDTSSRSHAICQVMTNLSIEIRL